MMKVLAKTRAPRKASRNQESRKLTTFRCLRLILSHQQSRTSKLNRRSKNKCRVIWMAKTRTYRLQEVINRQNKKLTYLQNREKYRLRRNKRMSSLKLLYPIQKSLPPSHLLNQLPSNLPKSLPQNKNNLQPPMISRRRISQRMPRPPNPPHQVLAPHHLPHHLSKTLENPTR